jgi:hypothetical protein
MVACKKEKPAPAVVEETPMESAPQNTDTSAVMPEEPALSQVGGSKRHSGGSSSAAMPEGIVTDGRYVVQVSVFKSRRMAGNVVEKLAAQGYPAYVAEVQDPSAELSGTYHRVRIGSFRSLAEAGKFGDNTLKPLGYDFWVDKKSMDHVGMRDGGSSSSSSSSPSSKSVSEPSEPAYKSSASPASNDISPRESSPVAPSLPEPPSPSATSPSTNSWDEPPAAPHEPASAPASSPASGSAIAPEPPAPAANAAWGSPSETPAASSAPSSAPADTGAPKLDDW